MKGLTDAQLRARGMDAETLAYYRGNKRAWVAPITGVTVTASNEPATRSSTNHRQILARFPKLEAVA
jgi:hypothetical protein